MLEGGVASQPPKGVSMTEQVQDRVPTDLERYIDALAVVERVGAVRCGDSYFEDADGHDLSSWSVQSGLVAPEEVCGVCIMGASILADVLNGRTVQPATTEILDAAVKEECTARGLWGQGPYTGAIDSGGTDYIRAVFQRAIRMEQERTATAVDAPGTHDREEALA
jgi:hypothetical protein